MPIGTREKSSELDERRLARAGSGSHSAPGRILVPECMVDSQRDSRVSVLSQRARDAARARNWSDAVQLWRECMALAAPEDAIEWHEGLAEALSALSEEAEAEAVYQAMRERWPARAAGWIGPAQIAVMRGDWNSAIDRLQQCITRFPDQSQNWWYGRLAYAQRQLGRFDDFEATRAEWNRRNTSSTGKGRGSVERWRRTWGGGQPDSPPSELAAIRQLIEDGRFEAAIAAADALPPEFRSLQESNALLHVARTVMKSGMLADLESDGPDFASYSSILVARGPADADRAIIVFPGGAQRFWLSMQAMHRILRSFGCHLVYVRDFASSYYLAGDPGRGLDYDELVDEVRKTTKSIGATRLFCIGNSAGAYGAMRFGLDLGAEAVLGFGTPTDPGALPIWRADFARLYQKLSAAGGTTDLRKLFAASPSPPRATLCYGAGHDGDREQAEQMAGLPTVRLLPTPGVATHNVIAEYLRDGSFQTIVAAMLEGQAG